MQIQFKKWLENSMSVKNRLVIYDFDSTIANVPEKPMGWDGSDWWGHPDSLSSPHYEGQVNHEVVAQFKKDQADPKTEVIMVTGRRGVISPSVRKVLKSQGLYGRRMIPDSNKKVKDRYQTALETGVDSLHPDEHLGHEEYYAGDYTSEPDYPKTAKGKADGTTLVHKLYVIGNKVNSNIETVEFWDDRADHIPHFIKFGIDLLKKYGEQAGGRLTNVILHRVFPSADINQQGTVQHIPIRIGMNY